jgi:hypothetical protein
MFENVEIPKWVAYLSVGYMIICQLYLSVILGTLLRDWRRNKKLQSVIKPKANEKKDKVENNDYSIHHHVST